MDGNSEKAILFSGSSLPSVAKKVAQEAGFPFGSVVFERFPDEEIGVRVENSVEGRTVFLFQSIARRPNEYLIELLFLIDAVRRGGAEKVVLIIPYFGYARQDRVDRPGVPIAARLVADLLQAAGSDAIVTVDLHAEQIEGFFSIPLKNLCALPPLAEAIQREQISNLLVVGPDVGSIKIARHMANRLGVDFAVVDKYRVRPDIVHTTTVIGEVRGKNVLLADDLCATAGTLVSAAKACRERGAKMIVAAVSHGLFAGPAFERIEDSDIEILWFGETVPLEGLPLFSNRCRSVSLAPLLASALHSFVPSSVGMPLKS